MPDQILYAVQVTPEDGDVYFATLMAKDWYDEMSKPHTWHGSQCNSTTSEPLAIYMAGALNHKGHDPEKGNRKIKSAEVVRVRLEVVG